MTTYDDLARVMHELDHGEELPQRQPVAPAPKGEDFARRRRELDGVELLPQQPVRRDPTSPVQE